MKGKNKAERLYYIHRNIMFQEAFEILQDCDLAADAVSESFMRILHHLDDIDLNNAEKTRNFLKVICRNVAIDIYRKNKREEELVFSSAVNFLPPKSPEDILLDRESFNKIVNIIDHMDNIYKDVLILSRIHNLRTEDIAILLGISPDAVTKRLQRAKAEIKTKLAKEEV